VDHEDEVLEGDHQTDDSSEDGGSAKGGRKDKDTVTISRKEYEAQQRRIGELEGSERYWSERATRGGRSEEEEENEDEEEDDAGGRGRGRNSRKSRQEDDDEEDGLPDDTPTKLTEDLTEQGLEALRKRGVITRKQLKEILARQAEQTRKQVEKTVRTAIDRTTKTLAADAKLMEQYPFLAKPDSEAFKLAQKYYKEELRDDPDVPQKVALRHAAKLAAAEIRSTDRDRRRRIQEQGDDYSPRQSGYSDEDDDLGPQSRRIISDFGIDEKTFRKYRRGDN